MTREDYHTAHEICQQVADRYAQKLPAWLQRTVDAEELTQLAMIAAWSKIPSPYAGHGGLIQRVARSTIVDYLRSVGHGGPSRCNQDRAAIAGELLGPRQIVGVIDWDLTRLESSDFRLENLDAYRALREPYQKVIRDVADGLKPRDLAERDRIPLGTYEWRVWRAITVFRQSLTPRDCDRLGLNAVPALSKMESAAVKVCKRRHPLTPDNLMTSNGKPAGCRLCFNWRARRRAAARRLEKSVCEPTTNEVER